jgi:hypothetical protein
MVYLLFLWGLHGPHVHGVFHDRDTCEALAETDIAKEHAAITLCVPMRLDNIVSDVVLYEHRLKEGEIREYQRSPNRP